MKKKEIENKIDDLIYQANHTSDFKRWQKINAQIYKLEMEVIKYESKKHCIYG